MAGPSINKVTLLGNLGSDPEVRYTQAGKPVASFSVATTEGPRGGAGGPGGQERGEARTEWHKVVVWDRLAELCGQYLSKGRQVYVEGRLQTRQWEDRNGQKQYTTEIVAREVLFLGGGAGVREGEGAGPRPLPRRPGPDGGGPPDRGQVRPAGGRGDGGGPPPGPEMDEVPYGDDDIPF